MKTIKRIIALVLIVATVALVGYLIYTGSRLSTINDIGGINEAVMQT